MIARMLYVDLESLIKNVNNCKNKTEKSSIKKVDEHIPCRYSMIVIWTFDSTEKKHSLYRGENCMKKCSISLRKHQADVINFEKKKMLPLTRRKS